MSDDIRPTNQLIYAVDIYDVSHCLLVDATGALKVTGASGGATEATLDIISNNVAKQYGSWSYYSGLSGTVTVSSGQRVLSISCHATNVATVTINSGSAITVPPNCGFSSSPAGNLVAPTIVFSNTDAYFIEVVS